MIGWVGGTPGAWLEPGAGRDSDHVKYKDDPGQLRREGFLEKTDNLEKTSLV